MSHRLLCTNRTQIPQILLTKHPKYRIAPHPFSHRLFSSKQPKRSKIKAYMRKRHARDIFPSQNTDSGIKSIPVPAKTTLISPYDITAFVALAALSYLAYRYLTRESYDSDTLGEWRSSQGSTLRHVAQSNEDMDVRFGIFRHGVREYLNDCSEWQERVENALRELVRKGVLRESASFKQGTHAPEGHSELWMLDETSDGFWIAVRNRYEPQAIVMRFELMQWLGTDEELAKLPSGAPQRLRHEVTAYGVYPSMATPRGEVLAFTVKSFVDAPEQDEANQPSNAKLSSQCTPLTIPYKWRKTPILPALQAPSHFEIVHKSDDVHFESVMELEREISKCIAGIM